DEELDRILDSPPEFKSFEEWVAAMKPAWLLDIDPDSTGSGSNFRFAVAMGREFAVSWLDGLRKAKDGDIAEEKDEVTARFPSLGKTIVIDRNTGFLRSIRNDLKSGGARLLTIREAKTGTPKPDIKLPGTVNARKLSSEEIAAAAAGGLSGHLAVALRRILERWEKVGAPERAESLRCFFSTMAARRDASIRRSSYQRWTTAFLESALGHGKSLDQLASDLEAKSAELQEYLHRGEDRYRDRLAEFNINFKNQVLKLASESSGSEQGKRALATRINEGFDPDRVEKARANLGAPDYKALLKQAIEEARAKK
ncbi:MAG TPA: hypothetical protein VGK61_07025, partial [Planctomycetota bacterium]